LLSRIPVINHVEFPVPRSFDRVVDIAHNLWWTWHDTGRALWSAIDPDQWEATHNPIDILHRTERHRWTELESRENVQERYREAVRRFDEYLAPRTPGTPATAATSRRRWPTCAPSSASTTRSPSTRGAWGSSPATT
jgi:Glucan phosphorylase